MTAETVPKHVAPKHQVIIHPTPFKHQPKSLGIVTNEIKTLYSDYVPVTKILDYFGRGHCIMLSNAEVNQNNELVFLSASLFAIDIDDDRKVTAPEEVLVKLKDKATGLFYTFSHGIKGNRYRLLFQLDRTVTDEAKMRSIIELVANDLKKMGLPVDTQAKNPRQIVRGGKSYILTNENNKLNTDELLERVKEQNIKRQQELYKDFEKELRPVPFDVLKEMAGIIGHIPTGTGQGELWKRLVVGIKHYANTGHVTQDEGFELFDIISGGEQSQRSWETLKTRGQATIGSFIHEAKERGYKGKYTYYANDEKIEESFERETIKVKKYISTEIAKNILTSNQRILVDSPTGSGKTTAFINAFKDLENDSNHFYIFAMPTIALTEQNAHKHGILAIKGQTKDLFKMVYQHIQKGKRIFITTYDMTPILIEFLKDIRERISFTLVVDELHKFVTDYDTNYRYEAIQNLYKVSRLAKTFIGLSGTIDDIYKNDFDKVIRIDNGQPNSPCQDFAVYIYENRKDAMVELAQLIEIWSAKRKLLIYIQSKDKIEQLKTVLQRKGVTVRTINANSKSNRTYKELVDRETIDGKVQVLLTTSVIADGINIQNVKRDENGNIMYDKNGKEIFDSEWEVIAICNDFSELFNASSLKQISNRLRNPYRRFSVFMQEPKTKEQIMFKIDNAFKYRHEIAQNIAKEINNHPYFDMRMFRKSVIERRYGIYPGIEVLEIDTLFLRHAVSKEQEHYYRKFRFAFIKAIEKVLHTQVKGILNITKEIKANRLETTFFREILEDLAEQNKQKEQRKTESIKTAFTEEVYSAFKDENEIILEDFKRTVSHRQYACLSIISEIADFQTCKSVVKEVNRDADTHKFHSKIRSLTDSIYFKHINRPSKTKQVFKQLLKLTEFITNQDYSKAIDKMATKLKVSIEDIKAVEGMVQIETKRTKKDRFKRVSEPISVKTIAEEFGLTVEQVKQTALNYAKTQGSTYEKIVRIELGL